MKPEATIVFDEELLRTRGRKADDVENFVMQLLHSYLERRRGALGGDAAPASRGDETFESALHKAGWFRKE